MRYFVQGVNPGMDLQAKPSECLCQTLLGPLGVGDNRRGQPPRSPRFPGWRCSPGPAQAVKHHECLRGTSHRFPINGGGGLAVPMVSPGTLQRRPSA